MPRGKKNTTATAAGKRTRRPLQQVINESLTKTMQRLEKTTVKVSSWAIDGLADDLRQATEALSSALGKIAELPDDFRPTPGGLSKGVMVAVKEKYVDLYSSLLENTDQLLEVMDVKNGHLMCSATVDSKEITIAIPRKHVEVAEPDTADAS